MKLTVSRAKRDDLPRVLDVWEASVRATHHFITEEDIQYFKVVIRDCYLSMVDLYCALGGCGALKGFIGVADGNIEMLFVDPAYFGKGVGSSLLSHAVSVLGADRVDVNEQNERALGFYERHGFVVTGRSQVDGTGRPYPLLHMTLRDQDRSGPAPTPSAAARRKPQNNI